MRHLATFLALALVFNVLALAPQASRADDAMILKVATISPEGTTLATALHSASADIEKRTSGRVKMKVYPGAVMGNDSVVLRKMRSGQLSGSSFTAGGISSEYRDYQVMSLPMLLQKYSEVDAVRAKYEQFLTQQLDSHGFVSFGIMDAGFVYMMSSQPIRKPDDMKGRKIWIPEGDPVGRAVFDVAGVPPVPLQLPDVLTSLQTGMLDTVSTSAIGAIVLQWYTKVKYLTETPILYSYGTFAFSKDAWNKIPEQDKPAVREIMTGYFKQVDQKNRKDNDAALQSLKKQGLIFVPVDEQNKAKMQDMADKAIDKLLKSNLFDQSLVAGVRATIQAVRQSK